MSDPTEQQGSTNSQQISPSDAKAESSNEPCQETVPLFIDPSGTASTESVHEQQEHSPNQLPVSITPPEYDPGDSPNNGPVTYSLKLPPGHEIRNYQHELAEPGIRGENYIFVAPTGSGKTLVAAMVFCAHLKKVQAQGEVPKVIFLVTTKPLAVQQQQKLQNYIEDARVACVVGDDISSIKDELTQCEIVVCTTGKFLNELKRKQVSLIPPSVDYERKTITLLVMDECHHARKSSSQAKLMHEYLKLKLKDPKHKLPQMIGLTASPGAGDNPNLEVEKTVAHLMGLCALLDATGGIVIVRCNQSELENCTTKPTLSRTVQKSRSKKEEFIYLIENEMAKLESIARLKCSNLKWSQQYETAANQMKMPLEISTNSLYRDQISTLKLLICYSQALNIYMDLRKEDALKVLEEYSDLPDSDEICTECERGLKRDMNHLISNLKLLPLVENQLLKIAEENILTRFKESPNSQGVFLYAPNVMLMLFVSGSRAWLLLTNF